jgi:hypothetical protein
MHFATIKKNVKMAALRMETNCEVCGELSGTHRHQSHGDGD